MDTGSPGARLPSGVIALGIVSLLMDTSSELIHSLLPIFLVAGLGASATVYGLIEGVAEASVLLTRMASGVLSDYFRSRKPLAVLGYGLAAASKPLFPLSTTVLAVFAARLIDRVGKGIRGAPRDALVADITPTGLRGAAYGLRQSLDSVGAVLGPLLALGLMLLFHDRIVSVFWVASIPALAAVAVLVVFVHEPRHVAPEAGPRWPIRRAALARLGRPFARVVAVGAVLTLARFSEGFLVLRARDLGVPLTYAPLVMVVMSGAYALSSYPVGRLSDRIGRSGLLQIGVGLLAAADLCLALGRDPWALGLGAGLWGLHLGFSQGLLAAMVADAAPSAVRGTAFGVFNLISGGAMLGASVLAGALWDSHGASATFFAGAGLALLAALGLRWARLEQGEPPDRGASSR